MQFSKVALGVAAIVGGLCLSSIHAAQAAVLNFDGLPFSELPGVDPNQNTPNPEAVLTDDFLSEGIIFGKPGESAGVVVAQELGYPPGSGKNSIYALDQFGKIPFWYTGDIFFSFVLPSTSTAAMTDSISFMLGDTGGDLDVFEIRSYNLAGELINTLNISGYSQFPVSLQLPGIHSVEIDFKGEAGYNLDNLTFNKPTLPSQSVPEPASAFAVLMFGTLGASVVRKRKAQSLS